MDSKSFGSDNRLKMKKGRTFLLLLLLLLLQASSSSSLSATDSESNGSYTEWKILTKQNFSSQIRLHPHILLFATLQWSGESRTLMRDVAHEVNDRREAFASLKLMLLYKNVDKMVADAIGASDETTIFYYHHSKSYKYQGRLRAQNVLSLLKHYLLLPPEDVPLKRMTSTWELKNFLESTDRAFLLLEFCGWTPKLLSRAQNNGTENYFGVQGNDNLVEVGSGENTNKSLEPGQISNRKGMEDEMKCIIGNEFTGIPWLGDFSSVTDSSSDLKDNRSDTGYACNFQEFQLFESFFSNFMTISRELSLPPERNKFGLISEKSLLSHLGIEEPSSWSMMLHYSGCPICSKMLKGGDDFKGAIQMDSPIVTELEGSDHTLEPVLSASKPSILLFVDRSSDVPEDRMKSKEVLDAFRKIAWHSELQALGQLHGKVGKSISKYESRKIAYVHPKLKLSNPAQKAGTKDKLSIRILNDGKHVPLDKIYSDIHGSSLQEIFAYLLQQQKEAKLSSVAKKVGFQLLSDDLEINMANLPSQTELLPNQVPTLEISQGEHTNSIYKDEKLVDVATGSITGDGKVTGCLDEEKSKQMDPKPFMYNVEKRNCGDRSKQVDFTKSEESSANKRLIDSMDYRSHSSVLDKVKEDQLRISESEFKGSFYFSDGDYRLLRRLTGSSRIPSLVIIDPIMQLHYVFDDHKNFSSAAMLGFMSGYLRKKLLPYQQPDSTPPSPRKDSHPPFINLDFHEAESIPRITARSLSGLIYGDNQSDSRSNVPARQKNVLVLFSNNWCGFCQRMELVMREVYRALKGYMHMLKTGSHHQEPIDSIDDFPVKLPLVYLLDCTLNDCSLILKSINKREAYPTLVLFPAENQDPVSYKGDVAVAPIIKFMAEQGSIPQHLMSEEGILWTLSRKEGTQPSSLEDTMPVAPMVEDIFHEIVLTDRASERMDHHIWTGPRDRENPHVWIGSVLIATEKLNGVNLFDSSRILLVKADRDTGFHGLIINKPLSWDSLRYLEEGLEVLREAPLSLGGPLMMKGLPFVALTRRAVGNQYPEILPGIHFMEQLGVIREIEELKSGNQSTMDYWFFLGYASWNWDQLFDEILDGAWTISDESMSLLEWPQR